MTIEIVGLSEGDERAAAETLKSRLEPAFRPEDRLIIVVGAKCYGQKRTDIDLLILGQLASGYRIGEHLLPPQGRGRATYLSSFCLVLEVKGHDGRDVQIGAGNHIEVRYRGRWSNASQQAFDQVTSVRNHITANVPGGVNAPFVTHGVWLTRVASSQLKFSSPILLKSDCTSDDFVRLLVNQTFNSAADFADRINRNDITISAGKKEDRQAIAASMHHFTRRIEPSTIDRRKLEHICAKILDDQKYFERLGTQLLIFRGRGGAGKTLRLLNAARTVYEEQGARTLLLTYNKALVSDVRRLLAILGVDDRLDRKSIQIRSSISFFFALLSAWGLSPAQVPDGVFPPDYEAKKIELLELFRGSSAADIRNDPYALSKPELFAWDYVLVDEGQDWPDEERDLLYAMFGPERVIVADGVDQFVRTTSHCDWTLNRGQVIDTSRRWIQPLRKSLRLKSQLCDFASNFAAKVGTRWDMEPNHDVGGGRVKLILGEYTREIHAEIMEAQAKASNRPIDALFCVTKESGAPSRRFPDQLESWGSKIWDGTIEGGRDDYPREVDQHRIVKYESCRGLEGWSVVCLDLDRFYDRKYREGLRAEHDLLQSAEEAALLFAGRWCLIPFTRAIDTLVLQFNPKSAVADLLLPLARQSPDWVEIIGEA